MATAIKAKGVATISTTPFRFLDLPAELRNRTYTFATERPQIDGEEVYLTKKANIEHKHKPSRRDFHSLTQVCRQIRGEFRIIYNKHNRVWIHAKDICDYLEMAVDSSMADDDKVGTGRFKVAPNLVVDLKLHAEPTQPSKQNMVNITTILMLSYIMPNIHWKFVCTSNQGLDASTSRDITTELNHIFVERRDELEHDIVEHFDNICIDVGGDYRAIWIECKRGFIESPTEDPENQAPQLQEIVRHMGIKVGGQFQILLYGKTSESKKFVYVWSATSGGWHNATDAIGQ